MEVNGPQLKLAVGRLLEASYSADKELTVSIIQASSNAQLTVDSQGNARLSGSAGALTFDGAPALNTLGVSYKRVSVNFTNQDDMEVGYRATINLAIISVSASGRFDLEELITSCSGLLCQAARALRGRNQAYEDELQRVMGH